MVEKIDTSTEAGAANQSRADDLLNDKQAAKILGVLPRTLKLWRYTRGLPFIRITSKVIRYRRRDIEAWLDRRRTVMAA